MACAEAARRLGAAAAAVIAAGCATAPPAPLPPDFPGVPPERDLRADFRAKACPGIETAGVACAQALRREGAEPVAASVLPDVPVAARYRIGLVPGFFAQCLARIARPFADAETALRAKGYSVSYLDVPGRGTAEGNAIVLAAALEAEAGDSRPWILVAYSKGLTDALELFVRHPAQASRVAAIVSIAGAALGTPLADDLEFAYRDLASWFPFPDCAVGTGEELQDLQPGARHEWWRRHGGAVNVPVLAIVAFPRDSGLSVPLRSTYRSLATIDPRNDGKVLWHDQLVPGGWLLGFVDADHWSIAVPVREQISVLSFAFPGIVPRAALVESALEVAAGLLAREAASGTGRRQ